MRTTIQRKSPTAGSVLIISMIFAGILFLCLACYLEMAYAQNLSVARSQAWNAALAVAEAGIEEGMAQLNYKPGNTNFNASATANWGKSGTTYGPVTRTLSLGTYSATIDVSGLTPVITSTGQTTVPPMSGTISRTVRVTTSLSALFGVGMAAILSVDLKGNTIAIDSYDSGDPLHSTPTGMYDPATRKAGGDVASPGGLVQVGNANINGKIWTGPYAPTPTTGPGGFAGDLNWTGPGIEPGWWKNDFNQEFPDVPAPDTTGWLTPTSSATNTYVLGNGNYILPSSLTLKTGDNMLVAGNATLYVPGNVNMSGTSYINITTGASLKIIVAGSSAGFTYVNTVGNAGTFAYYGLPSNTSLTWSGNAQYVGTIYAPEATFTLGGGGNNTMDYQGACVVLSVTMNGKFNFHFDENLKRKGPPGMFVVGSWKEL